MAFTNMTLWKFECVPIYPVCDGEIQFFTPAETTGIEALRTAVSLAEEFQMYDRSKDSITEVATNCTVLVTAAFFCPVNLILTLQNGNY